MKKLSLFITGIALSLSTFAQSTDSAAVSILPYYEPLHSDRPGFTFDAQHLRSGILFQGGTSIHTYDNVNGSSTGGTARFGTSIGEFDFGYNYVHIANSYAVSGSDWSTAISNRLNTNSINLGYRYSLPFYNNRLNLGVLARTTFSRTSSFYFSQNISMGIYDTLINSYFSESDRYNSVSASLFVNAAFQATKNFSISSSIGMNYFDLGSFNLLGTYNMSYSYKNLAIFTEYMYTLRSQSNDLHALQGGLTYNVSSDFTLDLFASSIFNQFDFQRPSINFGFTYFAR